MTGIRCNNLAKALSELGQREQALDAAKEAVNLYRQLAAARPEAFTPDLATSLNNLGLRLSELGQREQALDLAKEAVNLYRQLASARPEAFTPKLATSLGVLGSVLATAELYDDASAAWHEGLTTIAPFVEAHASAFNRLTGALGQGYLSACEKSRLEPDSALLLRMKMRS